MKNKALLLLCVCVLAEGWCLFPRPQEGSPGQGYCFHWVAREDVQVGVVLTNEITSSSGEGWALYPVLQGLWHLLVAKVAVWILRGVSNACSVGSQACIVNRPQLSQ